MIRPGPHPHDTRQQATVVYADISGFTALSEKLDPEEVTAVMNGVFERLEGIVVARGGIVNKYIGDCVMAVFGLTPGDRDASRQAVTAALELRAAVYQYNDDAQIPTKLDIHIGVNGGPVVTRGNGGGVRPQFPRKGSTGTFASPPPDPSPPAPPFHAPPPF